MNRKLLALAIGAAFALPMAAQAAPTVYGQMNLSVDYIDEDNGATSSEESQVNSNASRLGVKGEESLGDGLSAVYKAEWAVSGDTTGGNDLVGRDRFLGLKSDAVGTVKLGAYDSPLKDSQGSVDQFDDMSLLDMGNFLTGENRLNNVIGYESPKIADMLTINAALQSGEETGNGSDDDDGVSVGVAVETGGVYVGVAMDHNVIDSLANDVVDDFLGSPPSSYEDYDRDTMRLTATYSNDSFQIGAMFQTSEFADSIQAGFEADEEALLISGAFKMDKNTLKAQVITSTVEFGPGPGSEFETQVIALGLDHNFTQTTKVFVQGALITEDDGSANDDETTVLTVGMQTKF